mgnify:CR=1 FL=1
MPEQTTLSYALPATEMPNDVRDQLHPWIADIAGMNPSAAHQSLEKRWEHLTSSSLCNLRDRLLEFHPASIVVHDKFADLHCLRDPNHASVSSDAHAMFVPPPLEKDFIQRNLEVFGMEELDSVAEFFLGFAGLGDQIPLVAGRFPYIEWSRFADWWGPDTQGYKKWVDALVLYHALNGDQVLLHASGQVGWCVMDSNTVIEIANSFDEFIEHYTEFKESDHVFEAWTSRELLDFKNQDPNYNDEYPIL